jgi:hypothetical protein
MFLLPESIKVRSIHDLTPEDEVALENVLLGLHVEHQSDEVDEDEDMDENEEEESSEEEEEEDDEDDGW